MKNEVKIIANYLPQYHQIPENDDWWGEGFTDWTTVRNADSLYEGHEQPKVPLNNYYYDLTDVSTLEWQAKLAKEYGIYGFGIYHYWFSSNKQLLQKPAELILENKKIDVHFMFIWDNASWRRTWSNEKFSNAWAPKYDGNQESKKDILGSLLKLEYGDEEDWTKHFMYLLPFFQDERYIRIKNKPVFAIFNQDNQPTILKKMIGCWNQLAKKNGLDGVEVIGKINNRNVSFTNHQLLYEPIWSGWTNKNIFTRAMGKFLHLLSKERTNPYIYSYDVIWKRVLKNAKKTSDKNTFLSGFVGYDDTPRRGSEGRIIAGATPEKFGRYLKELINVSIEQEKQFVFLTAWNEWGEGAFIEPDIINKYNYLEMVKEVQKTGDNYVRD